ncbi:hypothetical protein JOC86_003499 [Bacillus pakistanensis]|uniref:Ribosomal protein S14 n=1 Tax=Rossellomorea pakistanensis TaxID=992288 RepID=A0ABS2NGJ3_9BACI|nr:hypothetical protein [Bacillus pakistanensis]MBM7586947.1 hypothetical protein [Bacillus pakistanensis]
MAKSKARKKRDHLLRNNGKDASLFRNQQPSFSTHERKTKTKSELLLRNRKKHKKRFLDSENEKGIVFILGCFLKVCSYRDKSDIHFRSIE